MGITDSARDQVLQVMCQAGWARESGGEVESSAGSYWLIYNEQPDLNEIKGAFEDEVESLELEPFDWQSIVGWWVVMLNSDGFYTVLEYPLSKEAQEAFEELQAEHAAWEEGS